MFIGYAISPIELAACVTFPLALPRSDSTNRAFAARRGSVQWLVVFGEVRSRIHATDYMVPSAEGA